MFTDLSIVMATSASGAVFFLGTRAHYQVLQQPESHFDVENGNSTETIYQNPSTEIWKQRIDNVSMDQNYVNGTGNYYCDLNELAVEDKDGSVKKRSHRRASEATLCEREDMSPASLNSLGDSPPKDKKRKSLLSILWSSRRKKRPGSSLQYLRQLDMQCTYRESCRCLHCQASYFDCDEEDEDYSSDDSEYTMYVAQAMQCQQPESDADDEVFVDQIPSDSASTDLLLEPKKMSVSSESETEPENLNIEVAAGTPVLLNYLLTHPVTCAIQ